MRLPYNRHRWAALTTLVAIVSVTGTIGAPLLLGAPSARAAIRPALRTQNPSVPLRGMIDLQAHPAMHIPWPTFFTPGLQEHEPTDLTWDHTFAQQMYAPFLRRSGVRMLGAAAMAAERADRPGQAHRLILDQFAFVERFISDHPSDFALARSPSEARSLLSGGEKMVFVHQIEGGRRILLDARDAWFWRSRGVSLVTVMHLLHDELGQAAMNIGPMSAVINVVFNGPHMNSHARPGLTRAGRQAIVALARAGIIVDLAHLAPLALDDALEVCRQNGIAPVVSHGMYLAIQDSDRGLTAAQIITLYKLGGMLSLPIDGHSLQPLRPTIAVPQGIAAGSMGWFRFHVEKVHQLLRDNATEILGRPWEALTDDERTRLSVGWASDWNGWTVHSSPSGTPHQGPELPIDRVGLAHPGLLPQHWQRLREQGMDLEPLERSLERFIQLWERARRGTVH